MSDESGATGRLVRESGKLSVLTMTSRVLGLIRERTRGGLMGTGALADAFTVAFNVPNLFRRLFAEGSMSVAFIPTVKAYFSEGDREKTEEFLSATFTALSVAVCAVVAAGIAASPLLARLFMSEPVETAVLMRVMFPFLALVSMAAFFQGILNALGSFAPSGFAPILFNLSFIFVPVLVGPLTANPARAMAVGVVVGGSLQALCQLPYVIRLGARFRFVSPGKAFANPGMRRVMSLIAPTILGMAAYEVNGLVSTSLATGAGTGAATALSFSIRLMELVLGVFVVSVGTVLLPELSGLAATARWKEYRQTLARALEVIALITVPVAVFSVCERVDIVSLVFRTREFGDDSVRQTAGAFFYHMMGLPFIGANRILAPAFYARGDTRTPAWSGILSVAVNIAAAFALQRLMGGSGIALALTIAGAVNTAALLVMLTRMGIDGLGASLASVALYVARLAGFSAIAALPVLALRGPLRALFGGSGSGLVAYGVPFALSAVAFAAVGVGLLALTKDPQAAFLLSSIGRRSKRRSN
ncbi:MAG: murein biosynthesis integral membrane protein MurJ [Spirochaetes bacterium]|nr:murein biosynthesis integral membrane protein MurJ [Spirochaetota bacterium]MBU1081591.1 murein biosynthesis integral membrane protein MurJ [Spirochaetota bacterium]